MFIGSVRRIAISGLRRHYRNRRCEIDYYFVEYVSECNWEGTSVYDNTSMPTPKPTPVFSNDDLSLHYEGSDSSILTVVIEETKDVLTEFIRTRPTPENICLYRVSQEECARLRESVSYVKVYRYNPKHLYPKLNGYGDNGRRSLKLAGICGFCNVNICT